MPILSSLRHTNEKATAVGASNGYWIKLVARVLIVIALGLLFEIILLGICLRLGKTSKERICDAITLLMSENAVRPSNPAPRLHV